MVYPKMATTQTSNKYGKRIVILPFGHDSPEGIVCPSSHSTIAVDAAAPRRHHNVSIMNPINSRDGLLVFSKSAGIFIGYVIFLEMYSLATQTKG